MADPVDLLWNNARDAATRSVAVVEWTKYVGLGKRKSYDPTPAEFNYSVGFIVDIIGDDSYVAVHESHVDKGSSFVVSVPGGDRKRAKVHLRSKSCEYYILAVSLGEPNSRRVQPRNMLIRGDILMLSASGNEVDPFATSVINPSTEAVSAHDWTTIAEDSNNFFTFGACRKSIKNIIGAPLFATDGSFAGAVYGDESTFEEYKGVPKSDICTDLKYARRAVPFISKLRKEIQDKLEPKGKKSSNIRRR